MPGPSIPRPPSYCAACGAPARDLATIPAGQGNRVLSDDVATSDLARHIGAVVMITAELDGAVGGLVFFASGGDATAIRRTWGKSGEELADKLRSVKPNDETFVRFADRYKAIYDMRNHIVHSLTTPTDAANTWSMLKMRRRLKEGEPPGDVRQIRIGELIDLWYQAQDLLRELRTVLFTYLAHPATDGSAEQAR